MHQARYADDAHLCHGVDAHGGLGRLVDSGGTVRRGDSSGDGAVYTPGQYSSTLYTSHLVT